MKVLIATGIFPPEVGGPATYSRIIADEFAKRGHEVRVVTYRDKELARLPDGQGIRNQELGLGFSVVSVPRTRFRPWNYFRFFQAVKKHGRDADVIYAQGPVSDGYPSYLASRVLKKPLVVKITGDYSWEQAMNRGLTNVLIDEFQTLKIYPPRIKRMRDIQKTVCVHAKTIITPSEYLKRLVVGWGIKLEKIRVIYNAVETPEVKVPKSEAGKKFLILSSGRDVPWKGFELLKNVVAELKTAHPEIELQILHDAPRQEFLERAAAADIYVLNTGYEGLSNTLVEVLRLGTPIVTTEVGGNPEIIKHEENGLLVKYNDAAGLKFAIEKLYANPDLRGMLAKNAGTALDRFKLENMINQTEEVLKSCVS